MEYKIKEKFWSFNNQFRITDTQGQDCFQVAGRAFSWGSKLSFKDMQGQELAFIRQKLMSWRPRYQIEIDGEVYAEVSKEFSWLKKKFILDIPGPNDLTIEGSFWEHEFIFRQGNQVVAEVSKKYWSWADSYGVRIDGDQDDVLILCACIVIDQVLHDGSNAVGGVDEA